MTGSARLLAKRASVLQRHAGLVPLLLSVIVVGAGTSGEEISKPCSQGLAFLQPLTKACAEAAPPGFLVRGTGEGRSACKRTRPLCRSSLLALYPPRVRYPGRSRTSCLLLLSALLIGAQLLPRHRLPAAFAALEPRHGTVAAAAQAVLLFPLAEGNFVAAAGVLLLTLLLGRKVEASMGTGAPLGAALLAGLCTVPAAWSWGVAPAGIWQVALLWAFLVLFTLTSKVMAIVAVVQDEPLKGCTTVGFWVNRWRLAKTLALAQFILAITLSPHAFGLGPFWEWTLLASVLAGLNPWVVWKLTVDKRKKKVNVKKEGDKVLDFAEGWLEDQEGKLDFLLQAADAAADFAASTKKGKEARGAQADKKLIGLAGSALQWFKGARKYARSKLNDGLNALASADDENLPVAMTAALAVMLFIVFLAVLHTPSLAEVLNCQSHRDHGGLGITWIAHAITSTLLLPSWLSLSSGLLLLVFAGRAVEVLGGEAAVASTFLLGGFSTSLICAAIGAAQPIGMAACSGITALLALALSWTFGPSLKLKHPRRSLTSFQEFRRSAARMDYNRALEAGLLAVFNVAWVAQSLPGRLHEPVLTSTSWLGGVLLRPARPVVTPHIGLWSAPHPESVPVIFVVILGAFLGATASTTLVMPAVGLTMKAFARLQNRFGRSKVPRTKAAPSKAVDRNTTADDE
eukprot:TRINITY_DN108655_c0_g1_i1.p1 TRINITY_DN108655_c0_g1~~TRINITY_DN108655_c0_g1_i1.p1  ORF type:complete len:686 (+),score=108.66 TRINITY_DN108655_c0_g1_i1:36-2093(+)